MSNITAIHGALDGAWESRDTTHRVRKRGHQASATDLPGRGERPTPIPQVTMESYVQRSVEEAEANYDASHSV